MIQFSAPPRGRQLMPAVSRTVHFRGDVTPPESKQAKSDCCDANGAKKASGGGIKRAFKLMLAGLIGAGIGGGYYDLNSKIASSSIQNEALQAELNALKKASADATASVDGKLSAMNSTLAGKVTLSDLAQVVSKVAPANVMVRGKAGLGSGTWLKDKDGNLYILTNHHVVEDNSIRGWDSPPTFEIRLHNGSDINAPKTVEAQLIKLDNGKYADSEDHDLALLGVTTPNFRLPDHVKPLQFRDMKKEPLKAGEFVVVVGTPYGHTDNVTHGIISHVERKFNDFEQANVFIGVDAPINPGNSGGSCYDLQGRYIGPPTAGYRGADGLGFVIRTDTVKGTLASWGIQTES